MGKKIFFQDGSSIEITTEILEPGELATSAYRRILEFIEELVEVDDEEDSDIVGEDLDDLNNDGLLPLDDDDDDLALDDDWDDDDDDDDAFTDKW